MNRIAATLTLLFVLCMALRASAEATDGNWPQFRGPSAAGVGRGPTAVQWDVATGKNIKWKVPIAGLAHSAPVIWGERIFLTTAVPVDVAAGGQELKTGLYGDSTLR